MTGEREALVALNLAGDLGPVTIARLVSHFGSAANVLGAGEGDLRQCPGVGAAKAASIRAALASVDPGREFEKARRLGVTMLVSCDPEYPALLRKIHDPPVVLYCFGDLGAFDVPSVAMVGTRVPSLYGCETARRFAYAIANAGYCVTSGMARGIDTESHRGALDAGGRTIGVLGGAIDCFYPSENRELGRRAAKSGGLVISEFPFGRKPDRGTFPMRNRIVSGLSRITLVVEAAAKSGSLITAGQAAEQGRTVMAIPGRIDAPTSVGCNILIRDGAAMAISPDDILDELHSLDVASLGPAPAHAARQSATPSSAPPPKPFIPLSPEEQSLLDAMGSGEIQIDEVIRLSGVEAGRANALLLALRLKRLAELLPGGWVRRKKG